jgi:hypothetical protein
MLAAPEAGIANGPRFPRKEICLFLFQRKDLLFGAQIEA